VKVRAIKYPRYLQGNNSFEKLTGYLSSVYMAQYSGFDRVVQYTCPGTTRQCQGKVLATLRGLEGLLL
jgi:hypothetical protein